MSDTACREYPLDDEVVESLQRLLVRFGKCSGELRSGIGLCLLETLAGEGQAS